MTVTLHTPPPAAQHQQPFTRDPGRWERERARALRAGHVPDHTCSAACELVLVHERTTWGWLAWTVPGDGSSPEIPHQIGVLAPGATRTQRLAPRWLTRRSAQHTIPGPLRLSATVVALISLLAGLLAIGHNVPLDVVLPAMLLAPLLAQHLPDRLDARAREHVRTVEGADACLYLRRLAALHTTLVQAAAGNDHYQLRRSAEIGHNLLWDAAGLLQDQDSRAKSDGLITRERLMAQLVHQVAQLLQRTAREECSAAADRTCLTARPQGPHPAAARPTTPRPTTTPSAWKGSPLMSRTDHTPDVYLLFAHEPYFGPGSQEINTTVVAAASLLHPRVRQPDGARIHDLLTRGRRAGETIPLATLTHELNGGADWPAVGDWERVTTDLVQLVRAGNCDALSIGLPEIARALVCTGPRSHVRAYDAAADEFLVYGSSERTAVLDEVGQYVTGFAAEQPFWPGDGLLPPLMARRG
ncbi:hypothetical protein [Streptomyces sp. CAS3]